MSQSAPASPAPQIAAAAAAATAAGRAPLTPEVRAWHRSVDWDAVRQFNEGGYQHWLLLQQVAAPAGPTPPQPAPPASPWDKPARLEKPAPATPKVGAVAPALAAAGPGEQLPPTPVPGADRPALPKGGPSPGFEWDSIPVVDIDDEPDAPEVSAASASSFFGQTCQGCIQGGASGASPGQDAALLPSGAASPGRDRRGR